MLKDANSTDAAAKAIFLYQSKERMNFLTSKAVLLISVGQSVHEGKKLVSSLKLINKNFKSCDIAVCDVLQRHTIQMENHYSLEMNYLKALEKGEAWIQRNKIHFGLLTIPKKIFRWENYLKSPEFEIQKQKMILTYEKDIDFKKAMDNTILAFIERKERKSELLNRESAFDACFNYLIEESAIIMLMWQSCKYNYIVYPGNIPEVLKVAHEKFVVPNDPRLLKWVTIYVRSKKIRPLYCEPKD